MFRNVDRATQILQIVNNLYLYLDLAAISGPLLLSFDKKVAYHKNWGRSLLAAIIIAIPFIVWDIYFTKFGIWGFNDNYITGYRIAGLPIEELLFFLVVPFSCTFIYECCKYYLKQHATLRIDIIVFSILFILSFTFIIAGGSKWYSVLSSFIGMVVLSVWLFQKKTRHLGVSFLLSLIPFLIMNGILTGMLISEPVVWYNENQMINIRVFTIPIQDIIYGMSLIFSVIFVYENLKKNHD